MSKFPSASPAGFPTALCLVLATLASTAASARDEAAACASVTGVQRRIVEHADQGMDVLRGYVAQTNFVHGIDMTDVKASLDGWRAAVACQEAVARAAATVEVASRAPAASR